MRAMRLRGGLLPILSTALLVACGSDTTPGSDTTDTRPDVLLPDTTSDVTTDVTPDVTPDVAPDTTGDVAPDVTPDVVPDTTEDVAPDVTPDTTEDVAPDVAPDTTEDVTPDVAPETVEDVTPETTEDTSEDTGETTPTSLASLMAPFADSANNFETAPNAFVSGLVVTLVKPDVGTELGGFFALDPSDLTPVYFAPAAGAAGVPAAGSVIDVTVGKIRNVFGMPMVVEFANLVVTGSGYDLDDVYQDASDWEVADWSGTQGAYIDLFGEIVGPSFAAGGGPADGYRRFQFVSDGLTTPDDAVHVRFPMSLTNALAIEAGCIFNLEGAGVWAYRGADVTATVQYQPTMPSVDGLYFLACDAPRLTKAEVTNTTTVVLTFSRPLDALTVEPAAFTFEPALTVLAAALSENRKTVTLTTATHEAPSYTVVVDAEVTDVLGEPIDSEADRLTFQTGTIEPVVALIYCFEEADGTTYRGTPTVVGAGFTNPGAVELVGGTLGTTFTGNTSKPAACTATGSGRSGYGAAGWPSETAFSTSLARYFRFGFNAPAGRVTLRFDVQTSTTGPTLVAVWQSATSATVATGVPVTGNFTAYPMLPPSGSEYAFDIPDSTTTPVEVRIYAYGSGATGTFRIDNLTVLFTPAE